LTATVAEDAIGGIERTVLKSMGFKIFEHLVDGVRKEVTEQKFDRVEPMDNE